ncbi:BRO family protein [Chrysiogenes arsenatis]|uniref:BRO family protein n=1 Tax=Chrysiogenes arsenatis TaxID=309797 RepID=UPI000400398D|nr:BRO family protein [Chrysiogenes arsenatis]
MEEQVVTSMATTELFWFGNHSVRVEMDGAMPWFNANDLCGVLEYVNPREALAKHVDGDCVTKRDAIDGMGRVRQSNYVSEFGMYALILASRTDAAKRFRKWVTSEVLPEIRRTGCYAGEAMARLEASDFIEEGYLRGKAEGIAEAAQLAVGLLPEHLKRITRYHTMGLTTREVCKLLGRDRSTIKRHKQRLRAAGFIDNEHGVLIDELPRLFV